MAFPGSKFGRVIGVSRAIAKEPETDPGSWENLMVGKSLITLHHSLYPKGWGVAYGYLTSLYHKSVGPMGVVSKQQELVDRSWWDSRYAFGFVNLVETSPLVTGDPEKGPYTTTPVYQHLVDVGSDGGLEANRTVLTKSELLALRTPWDFTKYAHENGMLLMVYHDNYYTNRPRWFALLDNTEPQTGANGTIQIRPLIYVYSPLGGSTTTVYTPSQFLNVIGGYDAILSNRFYYLGPGRNAADPQAYSDFYLSRAIEKYKLGPALVYPPTPPIIPKKKGSK